MTEQYPALDMARRTYGPPAACPHCGPLEDPRRPLDWMCVHYKRRMGLYPHPVFPRQAPAEF